MSFLVAHTTALDHLEYVQRDLYRLYSFALKVADRISEFSLRWYSFENRQWCNSAPSSIYSCTLSNTCTWIVPSVKRMPKNFDLSSRKRSSSAIAYSRFRSIASHSRCLRSSASRLLCSPLRSEWQMYFGLWMSLPNRLSIST